MMKTKPKFSSEEQTEHQAVRLKSKCPFQVKRVIQREIKVEETTSTMTEDEV